jgi:hypothetical protein
MALAFQQPGELDFGSRMGQGAADAAVLGLGVTAYSNSASIALRRNGGPKDTRWAQLSGLFETSSETALDGPSETLFAPTTVAFDAGLRPGPFPGQTASLLPGSLATTRTGLTPAGDDELLVRS